jgi:hypothetical protein
MGRKRSISDGIGRIIYDKNRLKYSPVGILHDCRSIVTFLSADKARFHFSLSRSIMLICQYMDKAVSLSEFSRVIIEKRHSVCCVFAFGIRQLPILAAVRNSRLGRSRYSRPPVHAAACPRTPLLTGLPPRSSRHRRRFGSVCHNSGTEYRIDL